MKVRIHNPFWLKSKDFIFKSFDSRAPLYQNMSEASIHKGYYNVVNGSNKALDYKYNGKELNEELGIDWYDYSARNYDATLGREMDEY